MGGWGVRSSLLQEVVTLGEVRLQELKGWS